LLLRAFSLSYHFFAKRKSLNFVKIRVRGKGNCGKDGARVQNTAAEGGSPHKKRRKALGKGGETQKNYCKGREK